MYAHFILTFKFKNGLNMDQYARMGLGWRDLLLDKVDYIQFSARLDSRMVGVVDELAKASGRSRNRQLEHMVRAFILQYLPSTYEVGDDLRVDALGNLVTEDRPRAAQLLSGQMVTKRLDRSLRVLAEASGVDPDDVALFEAAATREEEP